MSNFAKILAVNINVLLQYLCVYVCKIGGEFPENVENVFCILHCMNMGHFVN